jgi:osmotically-inducible protein OsmY
MAQAQTSKVLRSLAATGHTLRGVCYARPDYFSQSLAALAAIPPERVGLEGEYDYYGLAKRIRARFHEGWGRSATAHLSVKQRGSAVILSGQIENLDLLDQLIEAALRTEGASHVEVCDVQVARLEQAQPVQVA